MGQDAVDVLIVGAGASGAAVAYSLADMGLKILCLEQGLIDPTCRVPEKIMNCIATTSSVAIQMSVSFLKTTQSTLKTLQSLLSTTMQSVDPQSIT